MFLSLDGTFWVQLVNFAIFYVILTVVFLRPVQRAIAKRREYIDSLTSDYDRAQEEASRLRAQAQQIHADARRESDHILAVNRNQSGNEAAQIASEYAQKVQSIVEGAHETVAKEIEALRPRQDAIVRELADAIVGRVLPEARA
jgi:F0F1-type ATP synthase membrane subunit b/b'